jgi:hypothetical protein
MGLGWVRMPKIPDYDSQVTPVVGGVQPGSMFLPNIHTETGAPAAFAALGAAGEKLTDVEAKLLSHQIRQQQTIELSNAMGAYYKGAANTEVELSRSFDPNISEIARQRLDELRDGIVSSAPEPMRPVLSAKLEQLNGHSYKTIIDQYQVRQQHLGVETGKQSLDEISNTIIAAENDPTNAGKLASTWGSAKGVAASLEASGIYAPGQANKLLMDQVFSKRLGHDMVANPQETIKILQNPTEALKKYNLNEKSIPAAIGHATEQLHKQQNDFYNQQGTAILNIQSGSPGQMPSDLQIADWARQGKLSFTQGKTLTAMTTNEAQENDPETWTKIRSGILNKDPNMTEDFIINAMRQNKLKSSTAVQELTNLHNINLKTEPVESESYKRLDKMFKGVLGGSDLMGFDKAENAMKYYQGMTAVQMAMDKDKKAGVPWSAQDIQEKGLDILKPYIGNALEGINLPGGTKPNKKPAGVANIGLPPPPKSESELMTIPPDKYPGMIWNDGRGGKYRSNGTKWDRIN